MPARRLIAVPIVTLLAIVVAGGIVDAGREARRAEASPDVPSTMVDDPAARTELLRVDGAIVVAVTCSGAVSCRPESSAARTRRIIVQLDAWPYDQRFDAVRARAIDLLAVRADLFDQRSLAAPSPRIAQLEGRARSAERALIEAQRAAGLIDRTTSRARLAALD